MELSEHLRTPSGAAMAAAAMTSAYIYAKQRMNNEPKQEMSAYCKPAALNAIMVYFIVSHGSAVREKISSEAF
jgi:hypothetical protein|tara:strand:- start:449 stop:667 length:219 start_codon:yes stop_codon:yes gene_type:complete